MRIKIIYGISKIYIKIIAKTYRKYKVYFLFSYFCNKYTYIRLLVKFKYTNELNFKYYYTMLYMVNSFKQNYLNGNYTQIIYNSDIDFIKSFFK